MTYADVTRYSRAGARFPRTCWLSVLLVNLGIKINKPLFQTYRMSIYYLYLPEIQMDRVGLSSCWPHGAVPRSCWSLLCSCHRPWLLSVTDSILYAFKPVRNTLWHHSLLKTRLAIDNSLSNFLGSLPSWCAEQKVNPLLDVVCPFLLLTVLNNFCFAFHFNELWSSMNSSTPMEYRCGRWAKWDLEDTGSRSLTWK